ncbi:MAG: YraN family protein [Lachnospiraceae bacterium]|nr:YraN family protein [Lachnospiraceae bacterium]
MNKRSVGSVTEERAMEYLTGQGYEPVQRNYRCRAGEIDLVARDGEYLVFAEVKYRRTEEFGLPEEAVDAKKQLRIRRAAAWFLKEQRIPEDTPVRFDVVAMDSREIRLYKDAF